MVDVLTLKELLGHSNVGTTQIYTHLQDAQVRAAIEANPLGAVKNPKSAEALKTEVPQEETGIQEEMQPTGEWTGEALPEILPSMTEDFKEETDDPDKQQ